MTKQGNFTQRTPQAKKQSDQASRQISKQASGSANAPEEIEYIVPESLDAPVMRSASTIAKPCQGDSSEFYLITESNVRSLVRSYWIIRLQVKIQSQMLLLEFEQKSNDIMKAQLNVSRFRLLSIPFITKIIQKHIASNFAKLDKFEGVDIRRWQNALLALQHECGSIATAMKHMALNFAKFEGDGENATMEQIMKRNKWRNADYVYRGLFLNVMSHSLFEIYHNVESSKELWDSLDAKYMVDDASSKKFFASNFTSVMEQYNELLESHLRIEESPRVHDNNKTKGNNVVGPSVVNMLKHNNSSRDCKGVNVGSKTNGSGTSGLGNGLVPLKGQNMFNKSLHIYYVLYVSEAYFVQDDDVA
ncbi:hypothetical protein Tco_1039563 [Tanacetum coccineum]